MNPYSEIINAKRPVSRRHPPMPVAQRAAQFAPFAALTGYDEALQAAAEEALRQFELHDR